MQKLTKEQADWLIDRLFNCRSLVIPPAPIEDVHLNFIKTRELINQCTEKQFPEFKLSENELENAFISVSKNVSKEGEERDESEEYIFIEVNNGALNSKSYIMIDHKQFEEFAARINKIVEYLNETS